jgi:hypothetical protein
MFQKEEINIGSTGFSQFGTPDYYEKAKFEGQWLKQFFYIRFKFPKGLYLSWKRNQYEDDCYWDLNVHYYISQFKEDTPEHDELWEFINMLEDFDIESLEEQIQKAWDNKIKQEKIAAVDKGDGSHLSVAS